MRKNLPITRAEYALIDNTLIVSKTDLKGKLAYFNEDFVEASGFTEAELMGQPHNIERHPDMPCEAFDNLRATLKAGRPWVGAVKNRRKDGGFYWVLATASPVRENGKMVGYISPRTSPTSSAVRRDRAHLGRSAHGSPAALDRFEPPQAGSEQVLEVGSCDLIQSPIAGLPKRNTSYASAGADDCVAVMWK